MTAKEIETKDVPAEEGKEGKTRADFLRVAGVVAGAAIVGELAGAGSAQAGTDGDVVLGQGQFSGSRTGIQMIAGVADHSAFYGRHDGVSGIGLQGQSLSGGGTGVLGEAGLYGVHGTASDETGSGVFGDGRTGVEGFGIGSAGVGVLGKGLAAGVVGIDVAGNPANGKIGVVGESLYGVGVRGHSAVGGGSGGGVGVEGAGVLYGVHGTASAAVSAGVFGESPWYGVQGDGSGNDGYGVIGNGAGADSVGVVGVSPNVGVSGEGTGADGVGVSGSSPGTGVFGLGTDADSIGVSGSSPDTGVFGLGTAAGGVGVLGSGPGNGGQFDSAHAAIRLVPRGAAMPPVGEASFVGEMAVDSTGVLWLCVAAGTPGTWIRASHGGVRPLATPFRTYFNPTPVNRGEERIIAITGATPGVPTNALGIVGNLTVYDFQGGGFATLYPNGSARPTTSSINWNGTSPVPGAAIANAYTVGLGTNGSVKIYADATVATNAPATKVLLDVTAYIL